MQLATDVAGHVAGVVVAEGTFTTDRKAFAFAIALGASDAVTCELLHAYFDVGRVRHYARRQPHFDDEVVFVVRRLRDLVDVVVPFMDEHLPPSHKRLQYDTWRRALLTHWEGTARRRRPCTREGCDAPRRAKGLCRRHYYAVFGR